MSPLNTKSNIRPSFLKELKEASIQVGIGESKEFELSGQKVKIIYGHPDESLNPEDREKIGGRFSNTEKNCCYYFMMI